MKIESDIDLATLTDRFVEHDEYTKDIILKELQYWQKNTDFLVITHGDAFLIAHRSRDSLFIAQVRNTEGLKVGRSAIRVARMWAKDRGMTSMFFETSRPEMRAMKRYGFSEYSIIMKAEL